MHLSKLRLQALCVLALIVVVGWPKFRPQPTVTVWRADGPLAPKPELVTEDQRVVSGQEERARRQRSAQARQNALESNQAASETARAGTQARTLLSSEAAELAQIGAKLNAIVGRARTSLNQPIPYARLVLRNTSTGLIEARATADQEGRFSFLDVIPSGYVVELVGTDGSVIASSELVAVQNGDLRQATVRVAANSTVRAIFGNVNLPGNQLLGSNTAQQIVSRAIEESGARNVTEPIIQTEPTSPPLSY